MVKDVLSTNFKNFRSKLVLDSECDENDDDDDIEMNLALCVFVFACEPCVCVCSVQCTNYKDKSFERTKHSETRRHTKQIQCFASAFSVPTAIVICFFVSSLNPINCLQQHKHV